MSVRNIKQFINRFIRRIVWAHKKEEVFLAARFKRVRDGFVSADGRVNTNEVWGKDRVYCLDVSLDVYMFHVNRGCDKLCLFLSEEIHVADGEVMTILIDGVKNKIICTEDVVLDATTSDHVWAPVGGMWALVNRMEVEIYSKLMASGQV